MNIRHYQTAQDSLEAFKRAIMYVDESLVAIESGEVRKMIKGQTMKFINEIANGIKYLLKPKYVVMKGLEIENRAIMFIGKNIEFVGNNRIKFSNDTGTYRKKNIHKKRLRTDTF